MASPPAREAWIEILICLIKNFTSMSPPAREAWIEMRLLRETLALKTSPPAREAWIEIVWPDRRQILEPKVASREGGVD